MSSPQRAEDLPLPFMGEVMECFSCGLQERSDPAVESSWFSFTMDGEDSEGRPVVMRLYWCGRCELGEG